MGIIEFTIVGTRGIPFPMDMLRYDTAWPASTMDAVKIDATVRDPFTAVERPEYVDDDGRIRIKLQSCQRWPTAGRWESFGWKVVERS